MIRKIITSFVVVWVLMNVAGCSEVNSMEPFDDTQAAVVAKNMLPYRVIRYVPVRQQKAESSSSAKSAS